MKRFFLLFLGLAALTLAGCGSRSFGNLTLTIEGIDQTTISRTIQFTESNRLGPKYNLTLTVPESWVGRFQTRNRGNSIVFEFVNERGRSAPIFSIDALSMAQYWEQIGSLPGDYNSILNTADTYIVYHLPINAFYSGLPEAQYRAFADAVPGVIASLVVERA